MISRELCLGAIELSYLETLIRIPQNFVQCLVKYIVVCNSLLAVKGAAQGSTICGVCQLLEESLLLTKCVMAFPILNESVTQLSVSYHRS